MTGCVIGRHSTKGDGPRSMVTIDSDYRGFFFIGTKVRMPFSWDS